MKILGLIPARGGSKGIPRKNVVDLGGRPLIAWTIRAALQAQCVSRVLVSTDDEEIAATARDHGADVPFLRPAELANDVAPALPVIAHALAYADSQGWSVDAVAYLQPTSPFRTAADIDAAAALLAQGDTVVSVLTVPHNMLPSSLMRQRADGRLEFAVPPEQVKLRRQDKEQLLYARNGPAILLVRRAVVEAGKLYGESIMPYVMPWRRSLDIDTPDDLDLVRDLLPR